MKQRLNIASDIDEVFDVIGNLKYQQLLYLIYGCSLAGLFCSGQLLQFVFTGAEPEFKCLMNGSDLLVNKCPENDVNKCEGLIYTSYFTSLVTEWKILCSDIYKVKIVQTVYMAGVMIGAVAFGYISDTFGRIKTIFYSLLILIIFGELSAFASNLPMHVVFRFFNGIATAGVGMSTYVWNTELLGASRRSLCSTISSLFFSVGIAIHSFMAYLLPNWRIFIIISTGYGSVFLLFWWWLPESPHWLYRNGHRNKAQLVLYNIAKKNGTSDLLAEDWMLIESKIMKVNEEHCSIIITNSILRKLTLIQIFAWFVNGIMYYGLTFATSNLQGDLYVNTALSGLVEIPACLLAMYLLECIGRRITLSGFMIAAGIVCISLKLIPADFAYSRQTKITLAFFGKMFISSSFSVIYVHSAELFPTSIRNVGIGIVSIAARLGGMLSPFMALIDKIQPYLQFPIFGVLAFTSGLLNIMLPETLNRPLPETAEDIGVLTRYIALKAIDDEEKLEVDKLENQNEIFINGGKYISDEEDTILEISTLLKTD